MASLTTFLFSEYRRRVLGLLLLHPDIRYHVREIARLTHTEAGSLHRELTKLAKNQILLREVVGNQVYYQANIHFTIFEELASILKKTSGMVDVLANALMPLAKKIKVAFIFGSVSSGTENINSDVDVMIIGEISFSEAIQALYSAQAILKREINPRIYQNHEWKKLLKIKSGFIKEILKKPKLFIIGTENDIK